MVGVSFAAGAPTCDLNPLAIAPSSSIGATVQAPIISQNSEVHPTKSFINGLIGFDFSSNSLFIKPISIFKGDSTIFLFKSEVLNMVKPFKLS